MFLVETSAKNEKLGHLNPIFGKLGVTHDLGWWLVGKPVVDCRVIRVNGTFFAVYYGSRVESKCVQLGSFHRGSISFHSNFTWTGSTPINRS